MAARIWELAAVKESHEMGLGVNFVWKSENYSAHEGSPVNSIITQPLHPSHVC